MQTYPTYCILTKDWASHNGKLYHSGTTFKKINNNYPGDDGNWYEFRTPANLSLPHAISWGFVFIPNRIFLKLTEEEKCLRILREKQREEHIKKTTELFNI